jgi:hypothetical protein
MLNDRSPTQNLQKKLGKCDDDFCEGKVNG